MDEINWKSKIKECGLVLLFFVVLTLISTYPVILRLTTYAAGEGVDGFAFKWIIWHVNQVLTSGGGIAEIYHGNLLLYPHGASLAWHTLSLTNTLFIAFPLSLITDNLVLIYNLLFLFNFVMAGYAMYLLTKYLVKDRAVAFLVGFAYTFSPLHMAWGTGFLHLISFCWTPLFFLFFFKMFEEEKIKNAIVAAIFLFFLALADWNHLLFAFLIAVPYFIYKFITARYLFNKQFFFRASVFFLLFLIIIIPFIFPMINQYLVERSNLNYDGPRDTMITPVHYFLPRICHPFWEKFGRSDGIFRRYTTCGAEDTVNPGYLIILISLIYLFKKKKHLFWLLMVAFFFFLSISPANGLLSSLLRRVLFFDMIGVISRFSFGVLFSLLIFFAFSLSYFVSKCKQKTGKPILIGFIFIVLTIEYLAVPYRTTYDLGNRKIIIKSAEGIGQTVKGPHPLLNNNFAILDLPSFYNFAQFNFYFQTFHKKPIIGGDIARPKNTEMQTLIRLYEIINKNNLNDFQRFLKNYNIGYIIFYQDKYFPTNELNIMSSLILKQIPQRLVFITVDELSPIKIYVFEILLKDHME